MKIKFVKKHTFSFLEFDHFLIFIHKWFYWVIFNSNKIIKMRFLIIFFYWNVLQVWKHWSISVLFVVLIYACFSFWNEVLFHKFIPLTSHEFPSKPSMIPDFIICCRTRVSSFLRHRFSSSSSWRSFFCSYEKENEKTKHDILNLLSDFKLKKILGWVGFEQLNPEIFSKGYSANLLLHRF